ncbi:eukaryotic translation initiation factor 3 subunit A [Dorcoceras hygrometricum]|uniref:Eukaryotic translation initiation factor 3 subunit A n=1 Tax=Dorcoceras hygrometricum TaxID=472368 RepID=A0A2Z7D255_9LAMI|nr:eukaryotic translation initiation factor 3 subunit A [Dorcoceras hygrometricum]
MAAAVSAWAKPGGWALDSEENEAELLQQHNQDDAINKGPDTSDFPSLATAASTKTKKKKPQTLSLQEFATYGTVKPTQSEAPKGLTPDELLLLPTGPRQRSAEELDRDKLGGGFRSYGYRDEQPRRQGSFSRDNGRESEPSRADESDRWAAGKKSSLNNGFERKERGGFFPDSLSRADDSDNWAANKSFVPSETRRYEKRGSFGSDSSNWGDGRKAGGAFDSLRERRGVTESNGIDSDTWGRKREEESGGSGGRPRLNLKPRSLPIDDGQKGSEIKSDAKPKGNNPFGDARPREEVLKDLGHDVKAIEEKLESTKIKGVAVADDDDRKKGFWSGKGRETAWRKPEPVDSQHERGSIPVAANMVAVSLGIETDGSIIGPSGANAVVGIKATVGLTSRARVVPVSPRQDTIGPLCRTVSDGVHVLDAIVGFDYDDAEATLVASKTYSNRWLHSIPQRQRIKRKRLGE